MKSSNFVSKIQKYFLKKKQLIISFCFPALSGFLLLISSDIIELYFFSFFALVPLIYFLCKSKSNKEVLIGSLFFSFVYWGGFLRHFLFADVGFWVGDSSFFARTFLVFIYWMFLFLLAGFLSFWIFSFIFNKIRSKINFYNIFYFSCLWVLMEYLRAWIICVITFSPQSLIGPHNTFGSIGYFLAANHNLLHCSKWGGVYLLSFIFVLFNFLIYLLLFNKNKKEKIIIAGILLVGIVLSFLPFEKKDHSSKENKIKVTVIQTKNDHGRINNYQTENREIDEQRENILENSEIIDFNPQIVIFPEGADFSSFILNDKEDYYSSIFKDENKLIIDSGYKFNFFARKNVQLRYYDLAENKETSYYKLFLFPGGEDLPSVFYFLGNLFGFERKISALESIRVARGKEMVLGYFKNIQIGGTLCLEIVSPGMFREMINKEAELLVNSASFLTFRNSPELYFRILNIAKVRAVENNRYLVHAGNYFPSSIITNQGEVITTNYIEDGFLNGYVENISEKTFYSKFGDWIVWGSFFVVAIPAAFFFKKN